MFVPGKGQGGEVRGVRGWVQGEGFLQSSKPETLHTLNPDVHVLGLGFLVEGLGFRVQGLNLNQRVLESSVGSLRLGQNKIHEEHVIRRMIPGLGFGV